MQGIMTLEDFFTLTEMKDGLTAPARVKELVNEMQKEKYNIVKNVADATRQWSTVASTIAATENKDCLDLFVQLDGLCFFDSWLKDAQKFGNETGDSFVEESITALLLAIEKLHVDHQKSISSGILMTVKNLLSHNSSRIRDRARALFNSWKQDSDSNVVPHDAGGKSFGDGRTTLSANLGAKHDHSECSSHEISSSRGNDNEEKSLESARDEMMPSLCTDTLIPEPEEEIDVQTSDKTLDHGTLKDGPPDPVCSSDMLKPVKENNPPIQEGPPVYLSEVTTGIGSCGSGVLKQGTFEGQLDVAGSTEYDDAKQTQKLRSCEKLASMDNSSAVLTNSVESKIELTLEKDVDAEEEDPSLEVVPSTARTDASEGNAGSPNPCRNMLLSESTFQGDERNTGSLQNSSISDYKSGKSEDPTTYFSRVEDVGVVEEANEHDTDEAEDHLGKDSVFSRSEVNSKGPDVIDKRSDIELDYGIVDPLEVARQVAIEVEREVDCREPSCSSSEKSTDEEIKSPDSPDSIHGKKRPIYGSPKDVPAGQKETLVEDRAFMNIENLSTEQNNCIHGMDTEVTQKPEANPKGISGFDLNEEVFYEDMDHQNNPVATPISVVSASRAAAATGLPVAPLQFEGTLGWKGSAETSAFRPAPPRRITEGEKPLYVSGSSISSRQRQDYLDFDLNVTESGDDKITNLVLGKEIRSLSGAPSGESSGEPSTKRSDGLQLDLNRVSDGGDAQSDWRREGFLLPHRNGHQTPSHSFSSSSMQPFMRNIDLNDQPSFLNDLSDPPFGKSSQNLSNSGGFKSDDSVISIMGARVEVNRKDFVPQSLSLPNGRISDHVVDASLARTGNVLGVGSTLPFARSPVYGYNGPASGPTMPFPSSMYGLGGHIPYMMDSRGASVIPQILGSSSALPPGFSQPSFVMSMTGAPPSGPNGIGPSRHNLDLNSGLMMEGGNNRDTGGLRQFLNSGQGRSVDEHLRANSQPTSSSGVGGKRKEPDSGWEHYPFNYKHHQSPWK